MTQGQGTRSGLDPEPPRHVSRAAPAASDVANREAPDQVRGTVVIRSGDPLEPGASRLLDASHALMESLFPSEANYYLSHQALAAPGIRFFVAERGPDRSPACEADTDTRNGAGPETDALGCAALAEHPGYGEIKSMFVSPEARGLGVGAALLDHLITEARALGLPCLRLETGTALAPAHRLYRRHGFTDCAAFGAYDPDAPFSLYMERPI